MGRRCKGDYLECLRDDVAVGDLYGFGETCRAGAEGEEAANFFVGLARGDFEGGDLRRGAVGLALGDKILDADVTREGAIEKENSRFGNAGCGSSFRGNGDGGIRGGEVFGFGGLEGVGHFFDVVGWRRAAYHAPLIQELA